MSKLDFILKYKDKPIKQLNGKELEDYFRKDSELCKRINDEQEKRFNAMQMSDKKYRQRFTI